MVVVVDKNFRDKLRCEYSWCEVSGAGLILFEYYSCNQEMIMKNVETWYLTQVVLSYKWILSITIPLKCQTLAYYLCAFCVYGFLESLVGKFSSYMVA